jgi:hypothetical protein
MLINTVYLIHQLIHVNSYNKKTDNQWYHIEIVFQCDRMTIENIDLILNYNIYFPIEILTSITDPTNRFHLIIDFFRIALKHNLFLLL